MKIVIIGGTGLIGAKLARILAAAGHQAVAASPKSGVNTLTGQGLAEALQNAQVVVDVSNSPSFAEDAVMQFFQTSTANLLARETAAGVAHHVALSIVKCDLLPENGYYRAKAAQEKLIRESSVPHTIVRATQFFEFAASIAGAATQGGQVRIAPVLFQPIAADDVAAAVGRVALDPPLNGTVDIAGPDSFRFDEFIRQHLRASNDPREVVADPHAPYFGSEVAERSLVPDSGARLGATRYADWLKQPARRAHA